MELGLDGCVERCTVFLFVCFLVRSTLFDWLFGRLSDSFIHSLLAGWLIDHCVTNHFYSHVYACGLSILLSVKIKIKMIVNF